MTKKGFRTISVRESDYQKLEALRQKRGLRSIAETVASLL
jgi:predicted CopG family antitoxin